MHESELTIKRVVYRDNLLGVILPATSMLFYPILICKRTFLRDHIMHTRNWVLRVPLKTYLLINEPV